MIWIGIRVLHPQHKHLRTSSLVQKTKYQQYFIRATKHIITSFIVTKKLTSSSLNHKLFFEKKFIKNGLYFCLRILLTIMNDGAQRLFMNPE